MKLTLDPRLGDGYRSASQWARRVTEGWASANLYCVACPSASLAAHAANRAVEDYHCVGCSRRVQLKAKNGRIGNTVSNSAYGKKRTAILAGRAPDYCFMGYDRDDLLVHDLVWVPGHFITLSVVSKRAPLRATAERAGWEGSNIHLDRVPAGGKISLVAEGRVVPPRTVRRQFQDLAFVRKLGAEQRSWVTDILACLDELQVRPGTTFTNDDVYGCEERLATLHPHNRNIRPKIRQQLQVLAAGGAVKRLSPGLYERL